MALYCIYKDCIVNLLVVSYKRFVPYCSLVFPTVPWCFYCSGGTPLLVAQNDRVLPATHNYDLGIGR